jgi:hypothetical protein
MRDRGPLLASLLTLWLRPDAAAQDLEPRQYTNAPIGINVLVAAATRSEGNVLFDPSIELEDGKIEIAGPLLGYARTLAVGRFVGKVDAAVAHICLDGSATFEGERVTRNVCGLSDARTRLTVNFIGTPAHPTAGMQQTSSDFVLGASFGLSVPVGQYDADRLVNIGTHRWATKLEIGMSKGVGRWSIELALASTLFEDNDAYYGGRTRKQDPVYSLQAHAVRVFAKGTWLAIDATHYRGGQTETGGVLNPNLQANSRLGFTLGVPLNPRQALKINASAGVSTRTGSDFDVIGVGWQYRWGVGL